MITSDIQALRLIGEHRLVSRETMERLSVIVAQIEKWQPRINLVAASTLKQVWTRHIFDSLQLIEIKSDARCWLDLGSGGGFPGLVIAAVLADIPAARVTLVESNAKKCAFLRETSRIAGLPVQVVNQRIEDAMPMLSSHYDVVSARALAPLVNLLEMAEPFLQKGVLGIFPKGQDVDGELKIASRAWNIGYDLIQSQTESGAKVVIVRFASRCV